MKKIIVVLLFFAFGLVSGFYFFEINYSQKEVELEDFYNQGLIDKVAGSTRGIIISISKDQIKIDSDRTGKTSSFLVEKSVDLNNFSEGDQVRVEVEFNFEEQIFIIKRIQKI